MTHIMHISLPLKCFGVGTLLWFLCHILLMFISRVLPFLSAKRLDSLAISIVFSSFLSDETSFSIKMIHMVNDCSISVSGHRIK